ncbi:putative SP-containing protein [Vairimorpha necatrix]|uniref:SP-containing protein n=1 Tax=Vairimorpha necatrix TaxID=6039 RepID=A0AAX4J881_9MICR
MPRKNISRNVMPNTNISRNMRPNYNVNRNMRPNYNVNRNMSPNYNINRNQSINNNPNMNMMPNKSSKYKKSPSPIKNYKSYVGPPVVLNNIPKPQKKPQLNKKKLKRPHFFPYYKQHPRASSAYDLHTDSPIPTEENGDWGFYYNHLPPNPYTYTGSTVPITAVYS